VKWLIGLVAGAFASAAFAQVTVENPWARATPPNAKLAAGYMTVVNAGGADRLVGADSPAAARVETHITVRDGEVMRMRHVDGYAVPAKGRLELKPAGAHLMFIDLKWPFREGEKVPVTLRFEKAGEVKIELVVGSGPAGGKHGH
jgi:copper(I)-binding protein